MILVIFYLEVQSYFHECILVLSNNWHSSQNFIVHLFWEGHTIWRNIPLSYWKLSKWEDDFFKFLWPFQKTLTHTFLLENWPQICTYFPINFALEWTLKLALPLLFTQHHFRFFRFFRLFWFQNSCCISFEFHRPYPT